MKKYSPNAPCPCGSSLKYKKCCQKYHKGAVAPTAALLMRSRYSAYAVGDAAYIMKTTHPQNSDYTEEKIQWKEEIMQFCHHTQFLRLNITKIAEGDTEAYISFKAHLSSGILKEKSRFLKENGRWYYVDGIFK
ncbi:UPF0225 protein YchJ [hydrothermal vent metagenome]|uniref:UPF0225 protein YchJ n=1 Tax=hydrothermal vent metagenome TaxID=652676 RepID=A0A1W1E8G1_9ZZZZ